MLEREGGREGGRELNIAREGRREGAIQLELTHCLCGGDYLFLCYCDHPTEVGL